MRRDALRSGRLLFAPMGLARAGTVVQRRSYEGPAIPDSGGLHSRYDATELSLSDQDTVSTFPDETGNGHDLSAVGGPTFVTGEQNGNAVVRYDGSDDGHEVSYGSTLSQPIHIFFSFRVRDLNASGTPNEYIVGSTSDSAQRNFFNSSDGGAWESNASGTSGISGGSPNTNWHIGTLLYDGTSSYIRIDGGQIASGDLGTSGAAGLSLGYLAWNNGNYSAVDFGEFLQYPEDKSGVETDVELYLADKWGISI